MDGMRAAVDASAMLERGYLAASCPSTSTQSRVPASKRVLLASTSISTGTDFVGLDRLALPMGVPGTAWPASLGVELAM